MTKKKKMMMGSELFFLCILSVKSVFTNMKNDDIHIGKERFTFLILFLKHIRLGFSIFFV